MKHATRRVIRWEVSSPILRVYLRGWCQGGGRSCVARQRVLLAWIELNARGDDPTEAMVAAQSGQSPNLVHRVLTAFLRDIGQCQRSEERLGVSLADWSRPLQRRTGDLE